MGDSNSVAAQKQTIEVFFDLEKAYDTTLQDGILIQLVEWDIVGNMLYCLKDFFIISLPEGKNRLVYLLSLPIGGRNTSGKCIKSNTF